MLEPVVVQALAGHAGPASPMPPSTVRSRRRRSFEAEDAGSLGAEYDEKLAAARDRCARACAPSVRREEEGTQAGKLSPRFDKKPQAKSSMKPRGRGWPSRRSEAPLRQALKGRVEELASRDRRPRSSGGHHDASPTSTSRTHARRLVGWGGSRLFWSRLASRRCPSSALAMPRSRRPRAGWPATAANTIEGIRRHRVGHRHLHAHTGNTGPCSG